MTREQEIQAKRDQIARLQQEVRDLRGNRLECGKARIAPKHNYVERLDDEWQLSYSVPIYSYGYVKKGVQCKTLFCGTRRECVEEIPRIIEDLNGLLNMAKEAGV